MAATVISTGRASSADAEVVPARPLDGLGLEGESAECAQHGVGAVR